MLVPLADRPRLSDRFPWATALLAALLLLGYLLGTGWTDVFPGGLREQAERWGFTGLERPATLLSHLVVHASSLHLVGNVLLLLVFGPNVERRLGPWAFVPAFLLCGAVGALAFALSAPEDDLPLVGASAAALGIGALHAVALRGQRILVCVWLLVVWVGELPARLLLALFAALDLLAVFGLGFGGGRVAAPAHLGGLVAGALLGLLVRARRPQPVS